MSGCIWNKTMKNKNLGHKNYYNSGFNLINGLING